MSGKSCTTEADPQPLKRWFMLFGLMCVLALVLCVAAAYVGLAMHQENRATQLLFVGTLAAWFATMAGIKAKSEDAL